ncbi:tyrosine-type recombinase/integrase [Enterovibrio baiacu]|uniref:tyrosine-type recombinase/integrase n=1 Tax=Enterovibrio baiacu TaxID=2491023 RepID=UPI001010A0BB|nr:tyrosine-type recombinase/integrase [Enterovibrio baiacu]MBE1273427.1 integrase [Enterovibrio baiacu]
MKKIQALTEPDDIKASMTTFRKSDVSLDTWKAIANGAYSHNSLLSFQNDWETFLGFCREHNVSPLPAAVTAVRRFIERAAKTRKAASIKRYIITISMIHRVHACPDPTKHREVRFTLNKLYREKADDAGQATAFHLEHLNALHEKLSDSDRLKDIRDLLIWTLCFEGMLKRSELSALSYDAPQKTDSGFVLNVGEHVIALSEQAGDLIERWLLTSGIVDGPLLRGINKHEQLGETPMDHSSIYRVFRRAASELGEENTFTFSGQSPRVGASQDLSQAGLSIKEIQQQGRWKSPAMPAQYVGNKQARDEAMDKLKRKIELD